jgi:hypothetical protein
MAEDRHARRERTYPDGRRLFLEAFRTPRCVSISPGLAHVAKGFVMRIYLLLERAWRARNAFVAVHGDVLASSANCVAI